ncbi:formylglycine-generating enzyme family protein [Actinopolymorpha singaporensis]
MDVASALARIESSLVDVPAGKVVIGSDLDTVRAELAAPDLAGVEPAWLLKEVPRRTVEVPAFRIMRHLLTVAQVRALEPETSIPPVLEGGPDHPATVGAEQTFALCEALSILLGTPVRLPTEEEWVRAARGDDLRTYPWGDEWSPDRANLVYAGRGTTSPVGEFPLGASAFGLLDMVGNADELTSTRYAPFPGAPAEVPEREDWAFSPYITKGGSYLHARDLARCDRRHGIYSPGEPLGIRLVVR